MKDMLENEESPLNMAITRIAELESEISQIEESVSQKIADITSLNLLLEELRESLKNQEKETNRL